MGDVVREYVRAAQQAELRGDIDGAVELLIKSATMYRSAGRPGRALSMLRHALRLAPTRPDLVAEIRALESLPAAPATGEDAVSSPSVSLEAEMRGILAELTAESVAVSVSVSTAEAGLPGDASLMLADRGPQLSDPDLDAWCSFCCRPAREAGALVAGPAGAFICAGCGSQVLGLLGLGQVTQTAAPAPTTGAPSAPRRAVAGGTDASRSGDLIGSSSLARDTGGPGRAEADRRDASRSGDLIGSSFSAKAERGPGAQPPAYVELAAQEAAVAELAELLTQGRARVLLVGPEGSGKSVVLRRFRLDREPRARVLTVSQGDQDLPADGPVLFEFDEPLTGAGWAKLGRLLADHPGPWVIAMRGEAPRSAAVVITDRGRMIVPSTAALDEATGGQVPREVLESIDGVISLPPADVGALEQLASALLLRQGQSAEFVRALAPVLAREAWASRRGAHELMALLRRVPRGGRCVEAGPESEER